MIHDHDTCDILYVLCNKLCINCTEQQITVYKTEHCKNHS